MIISFKHKGLEKFFATGTVAGIQAHHAKRLRMQLAALDTAEFIEDMDLPGYKFHALKGERKGDCAVSVNGNWRITFAFEDEDAVDVNLEDYH